MKLPLHTEKTFAVHSIFLTIQGEGFHAGRRAVFIRMSGCNVWNGVEKDRERDAAQHSQCAAICDTEFKGIDHTKGGDHFTGPQLVNVALATWGALPGEKFVVFTGGEPSLQVNNELVALFRARGFYTAMETNGTNPPTNLHWTTLSPKFPMPYKDMQYDEVKLLSCFLSNGIYRSQAEMINATFRWIQPVDHDGQRGAKMTLEVLKCVAFVMSNPGWRMGAQSHKYWNIE